MSTARSRAIAPRRPISTGLPTAAWALLGAGMWTGIALLAARMFATVPPSAGFDLELLLAAGRDVAAGRSPYDPSIVAGVAPAGTSLFYSYPPLVAQAAALVAGLPSAAVFAAWSLAAVAGVGAAALALRARLAPEIDSRIAAAGSIAAAAVVLPFAIGILFGNLDAFFPLLYGLLLVGCLSTRPVDQVVGGAALAVAALAKVHPAVLGLWLVARLIRVRHDEGLAPIGRILAGAGATAGILVGLSVLVGGAGVWGEYLRVAAVMSGADLVDPRNAGPAAQLVVFLGGDNGLVRLVHVPVALAAVAVTGWAALARRDPLESLAWGAAASLFILPVTWYHYPAALLPFGIGAMLRSYGTPAAPQVAGILTGACALAAVGLVWPPLLWAAVGFVVAAAWRSGRDV
jgi:Glycosyltransferase family 87